MYVIRPSVVSRYTSTSPCRDVPYPVYSPSFSFGAAVVATLAPVVVAVTGAVTGGAAGGATIDAGAVATTTDGVIAGVAGTEVVDAAAGEDAFSATGFVSAVAVVTNASTGATIGAAARADVALDDEFPVVTAGGTGADFARVDDVMLAGDVFESAFAIVASALCTAAVGAFSAGGTTSRDSCTAALDAFATDSEVADFISACSTAASPGDNMRSSDCSANRSAAAAVRINPAPYTATTATDPSATRLPAFLLLLLTLAFLLAEGEAVRRSL